jgi:hypothetical protein
VKLSALVLACLVLLFSSIGSSTQYPKPPVEFSPKQVDKIIVLDKMNSREDDTLRLAAVAYTVHNGQILLSRQANKTQMLDGGAPDAFYGQNSDILAASPGGPHYSLDQIAARKATQLDGLTLHGTAVEKISDFSAEALALAGSQRSPLAAGTVKLLYPPLKEAVFRLVERDPRTPNLSHEFATEWAAWAYDQVRQGTPEGRALAPYVLKYQDIDPHKDNANTPPVQKAAERVLLIKNTKSGEEALAKLNSADEIQNAIKDGVESIQEQLTARSCC